MPSFALQTVDKFDWKSAVKLATETMQGAHDSLVYRSMKKVILSQDGIAQYLFNSVAQIRFKGINISYMKKKKIIDWLNGLLM